MYIYIYITATMRILTFTCKRVYKKYSPNSPKGKKMPKLRHFYLGHILKNPGILGNFREHFNRNQLIYGLQRFFPESFSVNG